MGLFWDLIQQSQISNQQAVSRSLEERVADLEQELRKTQQVLSHSLQILEEYTQKDLDGDGRIN